MIKMWKCCEHYDYPAPHTALPQVLQQLCTSAKLPGSDDIPRRAVSDD